MDDAIAVETAPKQAMEPGLTPGHPQEQLSIQDTQPEDETTYPSGIKLWMAIASLCLVSILHGLDLTIVAATVPSLTNYFKTVADIGWYSSAYSLVTASFAFLYGKLYSLVPTKRLYIISICLFELGSLLCTVAATSTMFILGRAVAGLGAAGLMTGSFVVLSQCLPKNRRPFWITVMGATKMVGIVSAPIVGGALIDWVGWRGCFGINLPLGVAAVALVAFTLQEVAPSPESEVSRKQKLKEFDWLGTVLMVPGFTCLLLALQLGGGKYAWDDARIIVLFVLSLGLLVAFGWRQHQMQDLATLPPRIIKMRTVLAGTWFNFCADAILAAVLGSFLERRLACVVACLKA
jgi:MFS family permease